MQWDGKKQKQHPKRKVEIHQLFMLIENFQLILYNITEVKKMSLPSEIKKIKDRKGYWAIWYAQKIRSKKKRKLGLTIDISKATLLKLQKEILNPPKKKEKFPDITLNEYFENYKNDFLDEPGRQTWSGKQRMHFEFYILPAFGKKKIKSIVKYDVKA